MQGIEKYNIHSGSIISPNAKIGRDVTIGVNVIVYDNVEIGDHAFIGPQSIIGEPVAAYYHDNSYENPVLIIGSHSIIRSGAIIYAGTTIGEKFECGHRVTIRENTKIGHHCRVGTQSDILDCCEIGDYTRLHSNVFVAQHTSIGCYVWLLPGVTLTNDPYPPSPSDQFLFVRVDDYAVICAKSVILPGIKIGKDALVGAMSLVRENVQPEAVVVGNPAKQIACIQDLKSHPAGEKLYPWRERFDRGMPWEGMDFKEWEKIKRAR
jgi:acetyltransferase-like isoleucine patch superfamily enzyme